MKPNKLTEDLVMPRSVLKSKDSHFSKALRRKQAGSKKVGGRSVQKEVWP